MCVRVSLAEEPTLTASSHSSLRTTTTTTRREENAHLMCADRLCFTFGFSRRGVMFHEDEGEEVTSAPDVCHDGSSGRRTFAPSVRGKKKLLLWLHVQLLLVLLAGQTSCNQTSAAVSSLSPTTNAQTSEVNYFVDITVDEIGKNKSEITAWINQVIGNNLQSCLSPTNAQTSATPTATQTTPASTYLTTQSIRTGEVSTTTTKAATITTLSSSSSSSTTSTTKAATTTSTSSTTTKTKVATTTSTSSTTTTTKAPTTTTTTKAATTTSSSTTTTTKEPTTTTPTTTKTTKSKPSKIPNPASNPRNSRKRRNVMEAQTSDVVTTDLIHGIETECSETSPSCVVTLQLKQSVLACCILRTLCAAAKAPSGIQVTANRVDRISPLQSECDGELREEDSCVYKGEAGHLCDVSESAYVLQQTDSAHCDEVNQTTAKPDENSCSCSAYCSGNDAYYTFKMSIKDPKIAMSYISSLISKLKQPPNCSPSTAVPCPPFVSDVASAYKYMNVTCENQESNLQNCTVILGLANQVPTCNVSAAVQNLFQTEGQIGFSGLVTRAAICGNSLLTDNPLNSKFEWFEILLQPAEFCRAIEMSTILTCSNGVNAFVELEEQCVFKPPTSAAPNVTAAHPNTTTPSANVTSSPPSTLNVTTAQPNTTTHSANGTSPPTTTLNVTAQANTTGSSANGTTSSTSTRNVTTTKPTTTTLSANVTSSPTTTLNLTTTKPTTPNTTTATTTTTTTLNTTTTTTNGSVTVTPSESPTTNASANSQANALLDLTRDVSKLNSSQVEQLVSELENLLSGPTVSLELGNTSVHIVSNLLGASPEALADSSNRIIGIVDTVGIKLVIGLQTEVLVSESVALSVKPADGSNFQETFFSISDPTNVLVRGNLISKRSLKKDSSIPQGSIKLPPSLTEGLPPQEQRLASRVQFNFYQKSSVFQDKSLGERRLNSGILGASVANLSITGLQDDVIIHLRNTEPTPANYVSKCVFWDFTLNDGSGGWNSSGCFALNTTDNETTCSCNHLTSFAILLDLDRDPLTSRLQATILTFITYIGCGVSAIFLSVTLLTYLAFGKLRKDIPSKILIQLCLSLLLLNLVFLVDSWLALYPDAVGLCISTAWFLHYFLLVSFTWMGLEAVHMYLALVKVFNSYISHYMLKFSLVGWGVPMIVVIIVIAVDKDNYGLISYGKFPDGTSDEFCWLKNDVAFYVAVVAYFCIIFVFNFVIFIVVLVQLCRIKRQNPHSVLHRSTLQDVRSVAGITILLGLTWGFAFFAWGPVNLAFMYLFSIFNSLQGLFIFVFHCAVKENVRRQWRTYLCCGRMRLAENSEWSRTATQKTAKKSSVTRLTSLHSSKSSKSNNSSNSSTFLVSESTEHINGIGSPFDDTAITADEENRRDVILNEINSRHEHAS